MIRLLIITTFSFSFFITKAQSNFSYISDVIDFMKNKTYHNSDMKIDLEFGYISGYNTNGIKLKSTQNGNTRYFINCDFDLFGYYADISGMNPNSGEPFSFRLYTDKIIVGVGESRQATFYLKSSSPISSSSTSRNPESTSSDYAFFGGEFFIPQSDYKVTVTEYRHKLYATVYKNDEPIQFDTSCGQISVFSQEGEVEIIQSKTKIYLTPLKCSEPEDPDTWRPNYITLEKGDNGVFFPDFPEEHYFYLNISIKSKDFRLSGTVKKVNY